MSDWAAMAVVAGLFGLAAAVAVENLVPHWEPKRRAYLSASVSVGTLCFGVLMVMLIHSVPA